MRKQKRSKLFALTALAFIVLFTSCTSCTSCSRNKAAGGEPVYSSCELYGDVIFYKINDSSLRRSLLSETNKWYQACTDPTCPHDTEGVCPAFALNTQYTLVVPHEESAMPLVYMFGARPSPVKSDDGKVLYYRPDTGGRTRIFDTATGEGRDLAVTDFSRVNGAWYTDGKIYMSVEYSDGAYPWRRVGMMDADTGKYIEVSGFDIDTAGVGISDGRFYFISVDGILHSCNLSLGDVRDEYDCGVGEKIRTTAVTTAAYVDSGTLYFEKNCRIPKEIDNDDETLRNFMMISDVYRVELDNIGAGEELVAENVREFKPYRGDLYYTVWNYSDMGKVSCPDNCTRQIIDTDGGTLYRYNHVKKASAAVVENCGTGFYRLADISDRYVMFEGIQYDGLDDFIYERTTNIYYFFNTRCVLDLESSKWHVVNNTYINEKE